jgi:hypothetical protein
MTKIPVKTRLPVEAWTLAVLVTLFSLISSAIQATNSTTPSVVHAKLTPAGHSTITSLFQ